MHFVDVEGHYDYTPFLTSNFVDECQSQGHILFKNHKEDLLVARNEIMSSLYIFFLKLLECIPHLSFVKQDHIFKYLFHFHFSSQLLVLYIFKQLPTTHPCRFENRLTVSYK